MICGGPLKGTYCFHSLKFHWGITDDNGSEHTIDLVRYALEVQAMHVRTGYQFKDLNKAVQDNAVIIISHFYQVIIIIIIL